MAVLNDTRNQSTPGTLTASPPVYLPVEVRTGVRSGYTQVYAATLLALTEKINLLENQGWNIVSIQLEPTLSGPLRYVAFLRYVNG